MSKLPFAAVMLAALPVRALANDSTAEEGAGGLQLVETHDIAMASEDLTVAPARIAIRYVFRNLGAEDQTLTVAFPLPGVTGYGAELTATVLPSPAKANFVDFSAVVDGKPVKPTLEERAVLDGKDVTATLKRYALPLNPWAPGFVPAIKRLKARDYAVLEDAGIITNREMAEGSFRYEAKYRFDMTFPAGREVVVEHVYKPVRGFYQLTANTLNDTAFLTQFCVDDGVRNGLRRVIGEAGDIARKTHRPGDPTYDPNAPTGSMAYVPYILTTANNWAGPIGRFHLTIDKGRAGNVVSLCEDGFGPGAGLAKAGPASFELTRTDFEPKKELMVLFASPTDKGLDGER